MTSTEGVPPEPKIDPNVDGILKLLAPGGEIHNAVKAQQEAMSALGGIYKKIEKDLHGNRGAVAFIRKLDNMSADKRNDMIRTLEPLLVERGYTLDVIDPVDLAANAEKGSDASPAPTPNGNSTKSTLDSAREKLDGAAGSDGEPAVKEVSAQLKKFLALLRGGESVEDAAETSGIAIEEARLHAEDEEKGLYSHVKGPSKPKLGIVPPASGKPN